MPKRRAKLCFTCNEIKLSTQHKLCDDCKSIHIRDQTRRCSQCNLVKGWDQFTKHKKGLMGIRNECQICCSKYSCNRLKDKEYFLKTMLNRCKINNDKRNNRLRTKNNFAFTWTYDEMVEKLEQLKDQCSVSGIPMNFEAHSNWQCSPERIDDSIKYIASNMTFVCLEFQFGHGNKSSREFVEYLCTIETRPHPRLAEIMTGEFKETKWKPHCALGQMNCKECVRVYSTHYNDTAKGRMVQLSSHTRSNTLKRNTRGHGHEPSEINHEEILKMMQQQQGKCQLTGHHMGFQSGFNCISLERRNVRLGYNKSGNCYLIMQCLNTTDCSTRKSAANETKTGNGGWTSEKIEFLRKFRRDQVENAAQATAD